MSDLIRREDAFKAIVGLTTQKTVDDIEILCDASVADSEGWLGGIRDALREVEYIPSAEPERIIKIGQRSGKTLESAIDYLHSVGWLQEHDRILTESAEPERKWIPVAEALPEEMDRILVTIVRSDGEKRVRSGHYYKGYFMMDNGDTWNGTDKEVIAWMPLVEPYRGDR